MRVKSCIICSLSLVNFQARMPLFPNWESNTLQLVQRMHVDWTIKLMSDIRAKSIPFPETLLTTTISHCSYLNIYISQKIRLCAVDLKGKFQTNLQAKSITFLVWKFKYIMFIFPCFILQDLINSEKNRSSQMLKVCKSKRNFQKYSFKKSSTKEIIFRKKSSKKFLLKKVCL